MPVPRKGAANKDLMKGLDSDTMSGPTAVVTTVTATISPPVPSIPEKILYDGGHHQLPGGWHFAWKPNRNRRDMEPLPKSADSEKYVEDMIYFNKDDIPAVIDTVEDLMMVATTIPAPHLLYEQERYFLFPAGHDITWEDPVFLNCGAVKMEIPAFRFVEDRALGAQFWITIVSMTTSGVLQQAESNFDVRGLRITRKKSVVVEFWIGRTEIPDKDGEVKAVELKVEEPKVEEPKAEELKAEEPKAEEPTVEEPKAADNKEDRESKEACSKDCLNSFMDQIIETLTKELPENLRVTDAKFSVQHFQA